MLPLVLLSLAGWAAAAPLRILAIGDSMTEEYAYQLPFSAPASQPTNANVRNWPELLRIHRPAEASLGPHEATGGSYLDLRNAGHEWNFAIPGMTTGNWITLLNTDDPFDLPDGDKDPQGAGYYLTRGRLIDELPVAEVVVIVLGANDLKRDYTEIFNGTEPAAFFTQLRNRIAAIHNWVRARRPLVPIVIATVPDVGATPATAATYHDPAKRAQARAKIAAFNQSLADWAATRVPAAGVARLDRLTDRVFDEQPFHLNGTLFAIAGAPENPPDRVFCRDGFHAATMAQAQIANEILAAARQLTGRTLTPFSNREILQNLLGMNPDQPFLAWIADQGFGGSPMDRDIEGDGIPNLVEFVLAGDPGGHDALLTGAFAPGQSWSWRPDPVALRFADLVPEESNDLGTWRPVPSDRVQTSGDGTVTVVPGGGERSFARLRAIPRP